MEADLAAAKQHISALEHQLRKNGITPVTPHTILAVPVQKPVQPPQMRKVITLRKDFVPYPNHPPGTMIMQFEPHESSAHEDIIDKRQPFRITMKSSVQTCGLLFRISLHRGDDLPLEHTMKANHKYLTLVHPGVGRHDDDTLDVMMLQSSNATTIHLKINLLSTALGSTMYLKLQCGDIEFKTSHFRVLSRGQNSRKRKSDEVITAPSSPQDEAKTREIVSQGLLDLTRLA
jgi:hypothetical protein